MTPPSAGSDERDGGSSNMPTFDLKISPSLSNCRSVIKRTSSGSNTIPILTGFLLQQNKFKFMNIGQQFRFYTSHKQKQSAKFQLNIVFLVQLVVVEMMKSQTAASRHDDLNIKNISPPWCKNICFVWKSSHNGGASCFKTWEILNIKTEILLYKVKQSKNAHPLNINY